MLNTFLTSCAHNYASVCIHSKYIDSYSTPEVRFAFKVNDYR